MTRCLVILYVTLVSLTLQGQTVPYVNFTVKDGLLTNYVYGAEQDKDGYIWAYTEKGLSSYDGYEWKNFDTEFGVDFITCIRDGYGDLYFHSFDEGKVIKLQQDSFILLDENTFVMRRYFDGTIFLDGNRMATYCPKEEKVVDVKFQSDYYYNLILDGQKIEIDTIDEKTYLNIFNKSYPLSTFPTFPINFNFLNVYTISEDTMVIYTFSEHKLLVANISKGWYKEINSKSIEFDILSSAIISTDQDQITLRSAVGSLTLNHEGQKIDSLLFVKDINIPYCLNVSRDREGGMWIGSRNNGLIYVPAKSRKVTNLLPPQPFSQKVEKLLKSGNNRLYAATDDNGLFLVSNNEMMPLQKYVQENFKYLFETKDNNIVYSSSFSTIFDQDHNQLKRPSIIKQIETLNKSNKVQFYIRFRNKIYFTYSKTLFSIKTKGNQIIPNSQKILFSDPNIQFYKDELCLWIVGGNIVIYADDQEENEFYLPYQQKVKDAYVYPKGQLYVLTNKDSLYTIQHSIGQCRNLGIHERGRSLSVYDSLILIGGEGSLSIWNITGNKPRKTHQLSTIHGIPQGPIYDVEIFENKVYLASEVGLTTLPLDMITSDDIVATKSPVKYPVHAALMDESKAPVQFSLNEGQNNIIIDHRLIHPQSLGNITYSYRLDPVHSEYITTTTTQIPFYNLTPGHYTYHVKAVSADGTVHEGAELTWEIKPYWYNRWWVRALAFMILGLLGLYFVNRRVKNNKEKAKLQHTMDQLKLSAIQAQMNPHFIFNALGSIQYFIQNRETEKADDYLSDFALLIRKILNSNTDKFISLDEEISILQLYIGIEKLRFDEKVDFNLDIDNDVDMDFEVPPMIIQPFIENAINHGVFNLKDKKGQINIHFTTKLDDLICTIDDNGIGREASKKLNLTKNHESKGMKIVEQKLEAIRQAYKQDIDISITDKSRNDIPTGTLVTITFHHHHN